MLGVTLILDNILSLVDDGLITLPLANCPCGACALCGLEGVGFGFGFGVGVGVITLGSSFFNARITRFLLVLMAAVSAFRVASAVLAWVVGLVDLLLVASCSMSTFGDERPRLEIVRVFLGDFGNAASISLVKFLKLMFIYLILFFFQKIGLTNNKQIWD